jgi:hypothetical protein
MSDRPTKEIWFPAKRYGWGWGLPCRWQGWVVLGVWVLLLALSACWLLPRHFRLFQGAVWGLAGLLVAVCWWKGEKPRWRWGKGD